jgi:hypothetical protein
MLTPLECDSVFTKELEDHKRKGISLLIDTVGIDGVYFDSTIMPGGCVGVSACADGNEVGMVALMVRTCLVLWLVFFAGCAVNEGSPTGPGGSVIPSQVVGTWTFQSATKGGSAADLAAILSWEPGTSSAQFTITSTGGYTYRELNATGGETFRQTGSIAFRDQNFTITITNINGQAANPPQSTSGSWSVTGTSLSMIWTDGGQTVVVVATK